MQDSNGLPVEETTPQAQSQIKELVKPQADDKDDFVEAYCQEGYSSGDVRCTSGYSYFWGYGAGPEDEILL